jgi:hypothetical protein
MVQEEFQPLFSHYQELIDHFYLKSLIDIIFQGKL